MTIPEAPEFYTQPSTPLSPLPVHPSEPSNIPVLRNQIDLYFNMTSSHDMTEEAPAPAAELVTDASPVGSPDSSVGSSFSDAYREQPKEVEGVASEGPEQEADEDDDDDDYAMKFDSEEEEDEEQGDQGGKQVEGQSEYQDVTRVVEQENPPSATQPVSTADPSSTVLYDPNQNPPYPGEVSLNGDHGKPIQEIPLPSHTPAAAPLSDQSATQPAVQTNQAPSHTYEAVSNGGIDIQQLLDNITANAEVNVAKPVGPPLTHAAASRTSHPVGGTSLTSHASLPPRPQISSYRPIGTSNQLVAAGAPGTSSDPRGGLPPPPTASFHTSLATPTLFSPVQSSAQDHLQPFESPGSRDDADKRWSPAVQKIYDKFLSEERGYVAEGLWDRFPNGSRLFIGNLPSEKVTKRDLFHVFHKYGRLAQVSIKQAYGFVQFHDVESCHAALSHEQGTEVRGKKIHLEISKPQRNTRNATKNATPQQARRSRSPDAKRGMTDRGVRNEQGRGVDNYNPRQNQPGLDEFGRMLRPRDEYRPGRSPSPPRTSYRTREDYGSGRDYYDGRRRSRSISPYGHRGNGRYRDRSPSPGARRAAEDADLQIPRRDPRDVPDIQIILLDELDRGFVAWVDGEIRGRGLRSEIMFLSPRLSVDAVIRRQILEGVHAVSQLDMRAQNSSKIPLRVFNRENGANDVRFDDYQDLEPRIAAELVFRAKQQTPVPQAQTRAPVYTGQHYPVSQPYQAPQQAPATPDLANLVGQLDNATLQKLLGALPQQQQTAPVAQANPGFDLAGILGGLKAQQQQQQQHLQGYPPQQPVQNHHSSGIPNTYAPTPQQQPPSAQQVQNIMAQLAKYRQ